MIQIFRFMYESVESFTPDFMDMFNQEFNQMLIFQQALQSMKSAKQQARDESLEIAICASQQLQNQD